MQSVKVSGFANIFGCVWRTFAAVVLETFLSSSYLQRMYGWRTSGRKASDAQRVLFLPSHLAALDHNPSCHASGQCCRLNDFCCQDESERLWSMHCKMGKTHVSIFLFCFVFPLGDCIMLYRQLLDPSLHRRPCPSPAQ